MGNDEGTRSEPKGVYENCVDGLRVHAVWEYGAYREVGSWEIIENDV
jgi:hypothetical protein